MLKSSPVMEPWNMPRSCILSVIEFGWQKSVNMPSGGLNGTSAAAILDVVDAVYTRGTKDDGREQSSLEPIYDIVFSSLYCNA